MFLSLKCKSCDVYYVVRLRLIVSLPKWGEGGGGCRHNTESPRLIRAGGFSRRRLTIGDGSN